MAEKLAVRDFIYLDVDRLKSILAQDVFAGDAILSHCLPESNSGTWSIIANSATSPL